jgi:hypothetical protein
VADQLEDLSAVVVVVEDFTVQQADAAEGHDEEEELLPDQLEEAAVPHHDHFPVPEERLPKKKFGFEIYFRY